MCVCLIRWHQCPECETMPTLTHRQPNKQANFAVAKEMAKETVNLPYKTLLFARSFLTLFNSLFGFFFYHHSTFVCVYVSSLSRRLPKTHSHTQSLRPVPFRLLLQMLHTVDVVVPRRRMPKDETV